MRTFSDIPIALLCGVTDKLASPHDYMWLRDELILNNNCVYYKEYDGGHVYFLMPKDRTIVHDILALLKCYNPLYEPFKEPSLEQKAAEADVTMNVANMTLNKLT